MRSHSMFRTVLSAAMLVAVPSTALAEAYPNDLAESDKAIRLQPISKWVLDFGDNRCRLARTFGSEADKHLLMFEQAAPRSSFGLTLAGPAVGRFLGSAGFNLGLRGDKPVTQLDRFENGSVDKVGKAIIIAGHSLGANETEDGLRSAGIDLAHASAVDRIVMERRGRVVSFETGNMHDAFQALNICTDDLLTGWGLDSEAHKSYVPPAFLNKDAVTRRIVDSYPRNALSRGEGGVFRMRVIVEPDGTVSNCLIENSTATDVLESPACREMRKAQFRPARDAAGAPMRSFYATSITYRVN